MSTHTRAAQQHIDALTQRYDFSAQAVAHMLTAVTDGQTQMAEFDHPEFGGPGMWMAGGLLMISRPNDHRLKAEIEALCEALGAVLRAEPGIVENASIRHSSVAAVSQSQTQRSGPPGPAYEQARTSTRSIGWPEALGTPQVTGAQNGLRYAWSGQTARLAIDDGGTIALYDTGDHRITGIAQQHSDGRGTLTLTSQHGPVVLSELPRVDTGVSTPATSAADPSARPDSAAKDSSPAASSSSSSNAHETIFTAIERLGDLKARDLITEDEFSAKKAELLARL